jgi:hypothetical protein
VPFEVVYDSAGLFGRWRLSGKRHACYIRLSGTAPFPALGAPWLAVAGLFSPLSITGDSVRVTSRYGYPDGRLATEIDTVSSQTHLIRRAWVSVPGSGSDAAVISFARYGYPAADAPAPRVTLCRRAQ